VWRMGGGGDVVIKDSEAGDPKLFDEVHVASSFLEARCREYLSPAVPVRVVHWGVDSARFHPTETPAAQAGSVRILYVGQILPHKGVHALVEAVKLLRERLGPGRFTLDIVGGSVWPEYLSQIEQQIAAAGLGDVVRLKGKMDRALLPDVYRHHDILAFPSAWDEPFSITLLEAMSSGLAVVATRTGGTPELVAQGVNGLVVERDNGRAMADAIESLISDPGMRLRLGQEARKTVVNKFQLDAMADRIDEQLRGLIKCQA
jgi:glycogen synthase